MIPIAPTRSTQPAATAPRPVGCSPPSNTLPFIALDCGIWAELEKHYGPAVRKHLHKLTDRPNLFTDPLPF